MERMTLRSDIGRKGEEIACTYLKERGYAILDRNVRAPWGELDIVARTKEKMLVIVEVKTMRAGELLPEDQMGSAKKRTFSRMASLYANAHENLFDVEKGFRLDVVCIIFSGENYTVRHYENALS